jgi:hypothetical protein
LNLIIDATGQLTRLAETVQLHDDQIRAIAQLLQQMWKRPDPPRRRIGFLRDDGDT